MIPQEAASEEEGLIPRAIRDLFSQVRQKRQADPNAKITVTCSYVQLYNEKVYDLLNSALYKQQGKRLEGVPGLRLRWGGAQEDVTIENLFCFECQGPEDAFRLFWRGLKNKVMAAHKMNNSSSRSHCILSFTVQQTDAKNPDTTIVSKLQLVDLAGSERQSTAGTHKDPAMMKECIEINKSLFTLRQVIAALTDNASSKENYVPYRESKLTSILRQSLGGNSFTLMLACITPLDEYIEENLSTLKYASRASHISNVPTINQDPKLKLINEQRKTIEKL